MQKQFVRSATQEILPREMKCKMVSLHTLCSLVGPTKDDPQISRLNFVVKISGEDKWKIVEYLRGKLRPAPDAVIDAITKSNKKSISLEPNQFDTYIKNTGANIDDFYNLLDDMRRKRYKERINQMGKE